MSDLAVLIVVGVLALGVPILGLVAIWQAVRRRGTRQRALTLVLALCAGVIVLGVVLPPTLMVLGLDPFRVWMPYAVLGVVCAIVLGWRWPTLPVVSGRHAGVVVSAGALVAVIIMAGVAVT